MRLPAYRLSVRQSMLVVAASAVILSLLRVNAALATVPACILGLAMARTLGVARLYQTKGEQISHWRWARIATCSLVISVAIIGSACLSFLFVYTTVDLLNDPNESHGPPPELDLGGVAAGVTSGVWVGYVVRRWLWAPRWRRGSTA